MYTWLLPVVTGTGSSLSLQSLLLTLWRLQVGVRQLSWKLFSSSCNAYQLDVLLRPLARKESGSFFKVRCARQQSTSACMQVL